MKKRLRKKLYRGEFQELGFKLWFRLKANVTGEAVDSLLDEFISEAIAKAGLQFGGGGRAEWEGFVTLERRGSVTPEQREQVTNWLAA